MLFRSKVIYKNRYDEYEKVKIIEYNRETKLYKIRKCSILPLPSDPPPFWVDKKDLQNLFLFHFGQVLTRKEKLFDALLDAI